MRGAGWSRVTHPFATVSPTEVGLTVRLACVRHAASVHPEPGSNSPFGGGAREAPRVDLEACLKSIAWIDEVWNVRLTNHTLDSSSMSSVSGSQGPAAGRPAASPLPASRETRKEILYQPADPLSRTFLENFLSSVPAPGGAPRLSERQLVYITSPAADCKRPPASPRIGHISGGGGRAKSPSPCHPERAQRAEGSGPGPPCARAST